MFPKKALFIERRLLHDRDLSKRAPRRTDFAFPGRLIERLREVPNAGLSLFVISNEDDIGRGTIPPEAFRRYAAGLERALASRGVALARAYHCPFAPNGVGPFRRESVHRLPNVGMMMAARQDFGVDLRESWLAARTTRALLAGARAGCLTALVEPPGALRESEFFVEPDAVVPDLASAIQAIVGHELALMR